MFKTEQLPTPNFREIVNFRHDKVAVDSLHQMRHRLSANIAKVPLESLLALAKSRFPEAGTDAAAIAALDREVMSLMGELHAHGMEIDSLVKAETDRLKPFISDVVQRVLAMQGELQAVEKAFRSMEADLDTERGRLLKAGLKSSEVDRLMADAATSREAEKASLLEKCEVMEREQAAFELFLKTLDERDLPEGYTLRPTFRVDASYPAPK